MDIMVNTDSIDLRTPKAPGPIRPLRSGRYHERGSVLYQLPIKFCLIGRLESQAHGHRNRTLFLATALS